MKLDSNKKYRVMAGDKDMGYIQNNTWVGSHFIDQIAPTNVYGSEFSDEFALEGMTIRRLKDDYTFTIFEE